MIQPERTTLLVLSIISAFLTFHNAQVASAQTVIDVTEYGAEPWSFVNATPALKEAINACGEEESAVLTFQAGRYDFWPEHAEIREYYISNTSSEVECPSKMKTIGLLFENMKNLTIEGNGSLLVFHGKMITFALEQCENITLQNIQIDFERPTMSEMTFVETSDSVIRASIHPDSRYSIIDGRHTWYGEGWGMKKFHAILVDPTEGTQFYSSWTPFYRSKAVEIAAGQVKFTGDFSRFNFLPGQVLTIRDPIRDHVGAFINRSKNIRLKNVSMHYMHGLGIISQFSEDLHYDNVKVMPRPESGRMIAAFADCMHFSGCKGSITIENSLFSGSHDDPVNVHGTHMEVTEILNTNALKVRYMHHQSYGFEGFFSGDTVAFVHSSSLKIFGTGSVLSASLSSPREMIVEFADPIPSEITVGDCVENITWTPSVTVRNCRFERTNTRGLLLTTRRKVVIEDNQFIKTGMHAILIADDASSWYESGPVQDLTIRNNVFENCGYNKAPDNYVIAIAPENHELIPGCFVHRNIRIEDNVFRNYDYPVLKARSTENLVFKGNRIERTDFMKPHEGIRSPFKMDACTKVQIEDNIIDSFFPAEIGMENMDESDIITDIPIKRIKPTKSDN